MCIKSNFHLPRLNLTWVTLSLTMIKFTLHNHIFTRGNCTLVSLPWVILSCVTINLPRVTKPGVILPLTIECTQGNFTRDNLNLENVTLDNLTLGK